MGLKDKIQQNIVNPADQVRGRFTLVAEVTNSDEKNNTCSIKMIDKDGYVSVKNNVPVKLYNTSIIDWFPVKGELVYIEQTESFIYVTSKYDGGYGSFQRQGTMLKKDILADSFNSIIAGNIL